MDILWFEKKMLVFIVKTMFESVQSVILWKSKSMHINLICPLLEVFANGGFLQNVKSEMSILRWIDCIILIVPYFPWLCIHNTHNTELFVISFVRVILASLAVIHSVQNALKAEMLCSTMNFFLGWVKFGYLTFTNPCGSWQSVSLSQDSEIGVYW